MYETPILLHWIVHTQNVICLVLGFEYSKEYHLHIPSCSYCAFSTDNLSDSLQHSSSTRGTTFDLIPAPTGYVGATTARSYTQ